MSEKLGIEEILMRDEEFINHFVRKHPPKYLSVPEVDYSIFKKPDGVLDPKIKDKIREIREYLTTYPLLEDDFGHGIEAHQARGKWRFILGEKHGVKEVWSFFATNKLTVNSMHAVIGHLDYLKKYNLPKDNTNVLQKINSVFILLVNPKTYLYMPVDKKIRYVRKIEDALYQFFECISVKQSPAPNTF